MSIIMMEMLTISSPEERDAEGMFRVLHESWLATYTTPEIGLTRKDIEEKHAGAAKESQIAAFASRARSRPQNDTTLVAKEGDEVIGFLRATTGESIIEIRSLYVLPEHTSMGIGTALWDRALTFLPPHLPVVVDVATNTRAVGFYERLGFQDTGQRMIEEGLPLMRMTLTR
jgi:ribosomal protein S18 acetylase RimI-like enzyme